MSKLAEIARAIKPEGAYRFRVIILCVLAAATFWFFNALNEDYSATVRYPLEFIYDQDKYIVVEPLPKNIQLNVSGLGWNLLRNNLGIKVNPIQVPLENPVEIKKISGSAMPAFLADQLNEFNLNFVITDTLSINIDRKGNRLLYLKVDSLNLDLEDDYRLTSPIGLVPDTMRVFGPESVLNDLEDTVQIILPQKNIDEDYEEIVPISINHPKAALLSRNPPTANINFEVGEYTSSSRLIDISMVNFPEGTYLNLNALTVNYLIPSEEAGDIAIDEFKIMVDYKEINPNDSTIIPLIIGTPTNATDVSLDSLMVKVLYNE